MNSACAPVTAAETTFDLSHLRLRRLAASGLVWRLEDKAGEVLLQIHAPGRVLRCFSQLSRVGHVENPKHEFMD